MKALFGVTVKSLSSVQSVIESKLGEKSAILYKNRDKAYSTKRILLLPNVNSLRSSLKKLSDWNGVAIVFDSPVNLYGIEKLQWLDVKRGSDPISYRFEFIEPRYSKLFEAYNSPDKVKIKVKKTDVLRALVINRSDTKFLELWHNLLYFCTSHSNREKFKLHLLSYFNGKLTLDKLKFEWSLLLRSDQIDHYFKEFLVFLKSDPGLKIKTAWQTISDKTDIAKAAKKSNVDLKDLRYIQRIAKSHKDNRIKLGE